MGHSGPSVPPSIQMVSVWSIKLVMHCVTTSLFRVRHIQRRQKCSVHAGDTSSRKRIAPYQRQWKSIYFRSISPCSPFSEFRAGRSKTDIQKHPMFPVTFGSSGSALSLCEVICPKRLMMESVIGFRKELSPFDRRTPMDLWRAFVNEMQRPDGTKHFAASGVVTLDTSTIVDNKRHSLRFPDGLWPHQAHCRLGQCML